MREDLIDSLRKLLRDLFSARYEGVANAKFSRAHGFLRDALYGLASTALSDYRQLRSRVGLQRYSESEIIAKLAAAGFTASRTTRNIGHNPWRMTFVARNAF